MNRVDEIRAYADEQHPDDGVRKPPELLEDVIFLLSEIDRLEEDAVKYLRRDG